MEKNSKKRELFQKSSLAIRESLEGTDELYIEGDAIMCGVETTLYEDDEFREVEVIEASCITPEFINSQNMFINAQHDRGKTFGRQGAKLEVTPKADRLSCRCTGTSNIYAETRALINDGVYTGMSFEFWPDEYATEKRTGSDGKTEYCIRHKKFRAIGALTVAMQPAYPTTSIGIREMYREEHPEEDPQERKKQLEEESQREAEKLAQREKETFARELAVLQEEVMEDELFAQRESI